MDDELARARGWEKEKEKEQEPQQLQEVSSSTTTTMKFSFSASKSKFSASRPPQFPKVGGKRRSDEGAGEDMEVEFVTGLDAQRLVGKELKGLSGAKVIPKSENSWRPEKKMKNTVMETDVKTSTQVERFEKEETVVGGPTPGVQYGFTEGFKKVVETSGMVSAKLNGDIIVQEATVASGLERTTEQKTSALPFVQLEEESFLPDLAAVPDVPDLDEYDKIPLEDFGEAMLRGMGWDKGMPFGRNSKVAVVPVEHVRRSGRTGLGAQPVQEVNYSRPIKLGESRLPAPNLVASVGIDGKVRNVVLLDEKFMERSRKGVVMGKLMSIISGRHLGLRREVMDRIVLMLVKSGEKVLVSAANLADIGSLEEEKVLKQIRHMKIRTHQDRDDSGAEKGVGGGGGGITIYSLREREESQKVL